MSSLGDTVSFADDRPVFPEEVFGSVRKAYPRRSPSILKGHIDCDCTGFAMKCIFGFLFRRIPASIQKSGRMSSLLEMLSPIKSWIVVYQTVFRG
jgi:hypothetical protein